MFYSHPTLLLSCGNPGSEWARVKVLGWGCMAVAIVLVLDKISSLHLGFHIWHWDMLFPDLHKCLSMWLTCLRCYITSLSLLLSSYCLMGQGSWLPLVALEFRLVAFLLSPSRCWALKIYNFSLFLSFLFSLFSLFSLRYLMLVMPKLPRRCLMPFVITLSMPTMEGIWGICWTE